MALNLHNKKKDNLLIFIAKSLRMFSNSMIALILVQGLIWKHFHSQQIGFMQSAIIFGDVGMYLLITKKANIFKIKHILLMSAFLKIIAGFVFATFNTFSAIISSGIIGLISINGGQIGPFFLIQKSILTQYISDCSENPQNIPINTSKILSYYNMIGYIFQACGAAFAGFYISYVGFSYQIAQMNAINHLLYLSALTSAIVLICYLFLNTQNKTQSKNKQSEVKKKQTKIQQSQYPTIIILSILFFLDSWADSFIVQSFLSFYFQKKFQFGFYQIAGLFFLCNLFSGISKSVSQRLTCLLGKLTTLIFIRLPSNLLLFFIPFVQTSYIGACLFICRCLISKTNNSIRQKYICLKVDQNKRQNVERITNIASLTGLAMGLIINGLFYNCQPFDITFSYPLFMCGATKILYDITLSSCYLWDKSQKIKKQKALFQLQTQIRNTQNMEYDISTQQLTRNDDTKKELAL